MTILILYYSRTGTTETVAKALAEALSADCRKISCPRYTGGWLRYLRAGYDSVNGRLPPVDCTPFEAADYDLLILGTPIWTSYPATPLRRFLTDAPPLPDRVALLLTHGGHSPPEKAVKMLSDLLPVPPEAKLAIPQDAVKNGSYLAPVQSYAEQLRNTL